MTRKLTLRTAVTVEMEVKQFTVPNFALADNDKSIPLGALDAASLSLLCDDFRAAVFEKAGKKDPRLA